MLAHLYCVHLKPIPLSRFCLLSSMPERLYYHMQRGLQLSLSHHRLFDLCTDCLLLNMDMLRIPHWSMHTTWSHSCHRKGFLLFEGLYILFVLTSTFVNKKVWPGLKLVSLPITALNVATSSVNIKWNIFKHTGLLQ